MDEKPVVFLHDSEFVHPVEAEFRDLSAAPRILAYLQRNPGKTSREIASTLAMLENTVRTALFRLATEGEVRKMPRIDGDRRRRWEIGEDDSYVKKESKTTWVFRHETVTTWEPETRRDELVAALFGAGPAQVAA